MEHLEIVSKLIENLEGYKKYLQSRLNDKLDDEEFDEETIYDDINDILTDIYYGN
jgi:hypothetical protein